MAEGKKEKKEKKERLSVVVLQRFRDKYNKKKVFEIGEELSLEKSRAESLITRGLAELKPA